MICFHWSMTMLGELWIASYTWCSALSSPHAKFWVNTCLVNSRMKRVQRGCGSEKQQYFQHFEVMSISKVIFLGLLRQVSKEECDDIWSWNGEIRNKQTKKNQWFSRPDQNNAGSVLATRVVDIWGQLLPPPSKSSLAQTSSPFLPLRTWALAFWQLTKETAGPEGG